MIILREDGSRTEYTLDELDRLTGERKVSSGGTTISEQALTYDQVGNRLTRTADTAVVS